MMAGSRGPKRYLHAMLALTLSLACMLLPESGAAQDGPLLGTRASLSVEIIETPEAEPLVIPVFEERIVGEGLELPSMRAIRGETGPDGRGIAETMVDIDGSSILITVVDYAGGRFQQAVFAGYVFDFPDVDPSVLATARLHRWIRLRMMEDEAVTVSGTELRINVAGLSFGQVARIRIEFPARPLTSNVMGYWP